MKKIRLIPDFGFITPALLKDYLLYTAFLLLAALSDYITPFVNTFFVSAKLGLAFTGIYTIAVNIVALIEVPYRSLSSISAPIISRLMKEGNIPEVSSLCRNVSMHQLLVSAFIFYLIWINIDFIYQIMPNGVEYATAKYVVLILGTSKLFYTTCSAGVSVISYSRYYYLSLIFAFFLTFTSIFLNNKLIPLYGMNGAALATLIAYMSYMTIMLIVIRLVIGVGTFSLGHIKIMGIFALLIVAYQAWLSLVSPVLQPWPDCLAKTFVLGTIGMVAIYFSKISPEVSQLIEKTISLFIHRNES